MPNFLQKPYPLSDNVKYKYIGILVVTVFVTVFLAFFQPFGIYNISEKYKWIIILGYGGVTALVEVILLLIIMPALPNFFNEEKWTVGKEVIWAAFNLFCIGLGNWAWSYWWGITGSSLQGILMFQCYTVAVGIFPITLGIWGNQVRLARQYSEGATFISDSLTTKEHVSHPQQITIPGEKEKDNLSLPLDDLLFIESADNYLEVWQCKNLQGFENLEGLNEQPTKTIIRGTLSKVEAAFKDHPQLFRCHRSYLVHLDKVQSVKGNAQGYRLHLGKGVKEVPVSRGKGKEMKGRLD